MKVKEARQLAKEKIEGLAQQLERGHSDTLKAYLAAMAKFPRYSVHNVMLILRQFPQARHVCGLTTWNRLGRIVRKGEHGIAILAPCVRRRKRDNAAEGQGGHPSASDDTDTDETVVGFRGAYVFDVSQTMGSPLPEFPIVAGNPGPYTDRLKAFIAEKGITLEYSRRIAPALGACIGSTIVLLPDLPPAEQLSTLAHEVGHHLLHCCAGHEPLPKTVRETEAEAVAHVVCAAIGLETNTASSDYIQLYQGTAATLAASLDRIQHAASQIIAAIGPDV
ncbi:MAG TPA: ArdC-like ssDNA-binding domain-containing protein [Phycisphaerae bacterium]|nr:ArdC-like ssDNA-binding domain-containing protein [Phycisphaerae bacterium]HNU44809.1 ArdC-like ssDNA-binding domain-containing protein [Phycisphaerae bacterium]